jgi:hypothetical protein
MRAASRRFRKSRRSPISGGGFGAAISLGVSAALVGFLVSGLMEWNLGDEELLDLLYVLVGIAFAAAAWPRASGAAPDVEGGLSLAGRPPDQPFGAMANRRLNQATGPPSPAR